MYLNYFLEAKHIVLIKRFIKFFVPYKRYLLFSSLLMSLSLILTLPLPWISMKIVDKTLTEKEPSQFFFLISLWFCIILIKSIIDFFQSKSMFNFQIYSGQDVRAAVYHNLLKAPLSYYRDKQTGYLISRVSQDIEESVSIFGGSFLEIFKSIASLAFGLVFIFLINHVLALTALALVPLYLISQKLFNRKIRETNKEKKEKWALIGGFLQEILGGLISVKAYNKENYEIEKFNQKSLIAIDATRKSWLLSRYATLLNGLIQSLSPVVIFSYAGYLILNGRMTVGELIGFIGYLGMLYGPATQIFGYFINLQTGLVSIERIYEILNNKTENQCEHKLFSIKNQNISGKIFFKNVKFCYEDSKSDFFIDNFNLKVEPCEVVGLVGRSGSGKTTIANLLLKFYKPINGTIFIDGIDIHEINVVDIRNIIGIVPQEPYIFSGTIAENIKYANLLATEDEMLAASKAAFADNFISSLPNGYSTVLGERGFQLSGGQKQMISIARVFLRSPKILILDEATSSIDFQSEQYIKEAINKLSTNRTTIIISHRLSTLTNAKRVVFLEKGKLIVCGSHLELYETNKNYRDFFESQNIYL